MAYIHATDWPKYDVFALMAVNFAKAHNRIWLSVMAVYRSITKEDRPRVSKLGRIAECGLLSALQIVMRVRLCVGSAPGAVAGCVVPSLEAGHPPRCVFEGHRHPTSSF